MTEPFHTLAAAGIRVTLDLRVGHVRELALERDGRIVRPLHTAPWVDDPHITGDPSLPGNLRFLSGDFFCAPFSTSDVEAAPLHGWPANSAWEVIETIRHADGVTARYRLARRVMGATLIKEFRLRDGHPFLYERHVFIGGKGAVPVANHAMVRFDRGGALSFSAKAYGETLAAAVEPDPARGRSWLLYPSRFEDFTRIPSAAGSPVDLTRYPIGERHEDFVMLVEAAGQALGWFAAVRAGDNEMFLSLKNPAVLPVTFLWFSNGGRDYAPWNGRHVGVLGIEEGRSFSAYGHRASLAPNDLSQRGIATALVLDEGGEAEVRNVIGGLPAPRAWSPVADVLAGRGCLDIVDREGAHLSVPYDEAFLMATGAAAGSASAP
ncbi:MAG: hypothetical protein JO163_15255 [Methylobacteriaceae bacterium]|nr:hypothetical protein [Methylobacteriaceae bacterium]